MIIAETDRLLIRSLAADDAPELVRALGDPEVMRFSLGGVCTLDDTCRHIERSMSSYEENGFGAWAVVEKTTSGLIGFCGFALQTVEDIQETEIGYRLARQSWGQGFASEAASAVLAYGFGQLKLESVIAIVQPANLASIRVAEKIGFAYFKESRYHDRDVRIYRKTRSEWR
jgi:ribosomal-protein-alanine N-acetyltransferase